QNRLQLAAQRGKLRINNVIDNPLRALRNLLERVLACRLLKLRRLRENIPGRRLVTVEVRVEPLDVEVVDVPRDRVGFSRILGSDPPHGPPPRPEGPPRRGGSPTPLTLFPPPLERRHTLLDRLPPLAFLRVSPTEIRPQMLGRLVDTPREQLVPL